MDDPNDSVSPRPGHGTRLLGLPIPSGGPFFSRPQSLRPRYSKSLLVRLHSPDNRNVRHSQHVLDFRLFQPRSIVFELQPVLLLIQPEFLQAVCVSEKCQRS